MSPGSLPSLSVTKGNLPCALLACHYNRTGLRHISDWNQRESGLSHIPIGYAFEEGDEGASMLSDRMWKDGYPRPHFLPKKDGVRKDGSPANA